jgi:hypothetical protein
MNLQREITITIDKEGKPTIEVKGVKGKKCLDLTRDLEKALGGKVLERSMTSEATQLETAAQQSQRLGV